MPGKRDSAVTDYDDTRKSQTWMSKNQGKHDSFYSHLKRLSIFRILFNNKTETNSNG